MALENSLKPGVDLRQLAPQWAIGYPIIAACFNNRGYSCVITSANDRVHGVGSLHPSGGALDFRTRHVPMIDKAPLIGTIRMCLGNQWDVLFEGAGTDNEHAHIEWDPKEPSVTEV